MENCHQHIWNWDDFDYHAVWLHHEWIQWNPSTVFGVEAQRNLHLDTEIDWQWSDGQVMSVDLDWCWSDFACVGWLNSIMFHAIRTLTLESDVEVIDAPAEPPPVVAEAGYVAEADDEVEAEVEVDAEEEELIDQVVEPKVEGDEPEGTVAQGLQFDPVMLLGSHSWQRL